MKPNHKLVDIKKNSVTRGSNSKNKSSLQKNSPYGLIPTTGKIKHHKHLSSEENTFKPIMVTFLPISASEVVLKPDYPN